MEDQCVITRKVAVAAGVFAPGHLGELTQVVDFALVDAVLAETGRVQRRVRLLPARVVVYFVLGLALFERCDYRAVWGKLVAGLAGLGLTRPSVSGLCRARRRVGAAPLAALFAAVCGPVGCADTPGVFWRGLRMVAIDGTGLHVPDRPALRAVHAKRRTRGVEFGYPLLRLVALVECGTRALIGAVFGSECDGEGVYARRLVDTMDVGMLVLADAQFDDWQLLADVAGTGAQYLVRSGARRIPLILDRLPDGSYLSVLGRGKLRVRVIEAWITVTYADGTIRREQWRLITSLLDHGRYPARELASLYHQRWEIETTYYSIKHTILDGRVLRSHQPADIDQELYALLVVYQAIVRITTDAVATQPGTDPDRISLTIAVHTARDQVTTAAAVFTNPTNVPIGPIGHAVLGNLLPARRQRARARTVKNPTSKYSPNAGRKPARDLPYTLHTQIMIMEDGLTARQRH